MFPIHNSTAIYRTGKRRDLAWTPIGERPLKALITPRCSNLTSNFNAVKRFEANTAGDKPPPYSCLRIRFWKRKGFRNDTISYLLSPSITSGRGTGLRPRVLSHNRWVAPGFCRGSSLTLMKKRTEGDKPPPYNPSFKVLSGPKPAAAGESRRDSLTAYANPITSLKPGMSRKPCPLTLKAITFSSPLSLHFKASSMAQAMLYADSGAGR